MPARSARPGSRPGSPGAEELVVAELLERVHLEAVQRPHPGQLERTDHHVPAAVLLQVEKGIRDGQRDLVAELRASARCPRRSGRPARRARSYTCRNGCYPPAATGSFPGGSGVFLEEFSPKWSLVCLICAARRRGASRPRADPRRSPSRSQAPRAPSSRRSGAIRPSTGPRRRARRSAAPTGQWLDANGLPCTDCTFRYTWQRCNADSSGCTDVPGATSFNYLLGAADVGRRIRIVEWIFKRDCGEINYRRARRSATTSRRTERPRRRRSSRRSP